MLIDSRLLDGSYPSVVSDRVLLAGFEFTIVIENISQCWFSTVLQPVETSTMVLQFKVSDAVM